MRPTARRGPAGRSNRVAPVADGRAIRVGLIGGGSIAQAHLDGYLLAGDAAQVTAVAVIEAVVGSGITLMCAHNQLFLPAVAKAAEMVREGVLGKVYEARTTDAFV